MPDADAIYFAWVDELAARADQLQAVSKDRQFVGEIGLTQVVLFLAGGMAAGFVAKFGDSLADSMLKKLSTLAHRRKQADNDDGGTAEEEIAFGIESVGLVVTVMNELNEVSYSIELLVTNLRQLGYDDGTARMLATALAQVPPLLEQHDTDA